MKQAETTIAEPKFAFQTKPPQSAGPALRAWVSQNAEMCQPDRVIWCDGSVAERSALFTQGVSDGIFIPLSPAKRPGCYLHRSNQNDVARSEHLTFICSPAQDMVGPTLTTGWKPRPPMPSCAPFSPAACAAARCMSCHL